MWYNTKQTILYFDTFSWNVCKKKYIHINILQLKYITYLCTIYSSRDRSVHMQTCWKHVHGVIIITPAWSGQKEFLFQHSSFNSWKLNRLLNSILVKCVNYVYYFLSAVNTWLHIYIFINTDSIFGEICIPFSFVANSFFFTSANGKYTISF